MWYLRFNLVAAERRHPALATGVAIVAVLAFLSVPFARVLVINPTSSLPRGLYVRTQDLPAVGRIIEFRVPPAVRANLSERIDYILKPIVAGPGDDVDTRDDRVRINGRPVAGAIVQSVDAAGRPLPKWGGHRRLGDGEYFVLSTRIPNSLDSRYYGPVRAADVLAVRRCVWAWGG